MGLAASQARMLSLTARKSDLEFRGQMINQQRMKLAWATEAVACEYTAAMSNRKLQLVMVNNDGSKTNVDLSAANLANYGLNLKVNSGTNAGKTIMTAGSFLSDMGWGGSDAITGQRLCNKENTCPDGSGYYTVGTPLSSFSIGNNHYNWDSTEKAYICDSGTEAGNKLKDSTNIEADTSSIPQSSGWSDASVNSVPLSHVAIETGLRDGRYTLMNGTEKIDYSYTADSGITDNYDTSDDAVAQAKYTSDSAKLQTQDRILEIELKNVDTQHNAVQTEMDAVKKVIEKNIEGSFKTFG